MYVCMGAGKPKLMTSSDLLVRLPKLSDIHTYICDVGMYDTRTHTAYRHSPRVANVSSFEQPPPTPVPFASSGTKACSARCRTALYAQHGLCDFSGVRLARRNAAD